MKKANASAKSKELLKKNINIYKIIAMLFVIVFFSTCKKENMCDCIKRTGPILIETREIIGFDKIFVSDNLNVFITQDSIFEVKVEAGKNVRGLITTEVSGGTLTIKNNNRCNWARSYNKPFNIYIKMPVIKFITSDGTGDIKSLNPITSSAFDVSVGNSGNVELTVNNSHITSHMFGAGDLILHGNTNEHDCDIGGQGFLKCQDLLTNNTWVHTFTTGNCYVFARNILWCKIDYIGDVNCYGNPAAIEKTRNGTGQLYLK